MIWRKITIDSLVGRTLVSHGRQRVLYRNASFSTALTIQDEEYTTYTDKGGRLHPTRYIGGDG